MTCLSGQLQWVSLPPQSSSKQQSLKPTQLIQEYMALCLHTTASPEAQHRWLHTHTCHSITQFHLEPRSVGFCPRVEGCLKHEPCQGCGRYHILLHSVGIWHSASLIWTVHMRLQVVILSQRGLLELTTEECAPMVVRSTF